MTSKLSRLLAAALALTLALSAPLSAFAAQSAVPGDPGEAAQPMAVSVPDYSPTDAVGAVENIQAGELYTLIVLPASQVAEGSSAQDLTAPLLAASDPLFVGSAVASADGKVTFTGIRLRSAEASVYYVTGPGLTPPLKEVCGLSNAVYGRIYRTLSGVKLGVADAQVSLEDKDTEYSYSNRVLSGSGAGDPNAVGSYSLEGLSPGSYRVHVEKPGYIPVTHPRYFELGDDTTILGHDIDLSAYLGDVNGDGKRNMADLTALLSCYGKPLSSAPRGFTPNLYDADQTVDAMDVFMLLNAMISHDGLSQGTGAPTGAAVLVQDAAPLDQTDRALTFSVDSGGVDGLTFTAASVTLTFRTDYIQPINAGGGAVNPGNPATAANCLFPKSGVTVSDASWSVEGDLATLTFSLSCAQPTALTDLVELRYRPAAGRSVTDLFDGVFAIPHAAAQVGEVTVIPTGDFTLTLPRFSSQTLDSLTIDQQPTDIILPAEGQTAVFVLTATGVRDGITLPDLSGVTWALAEPVPGVSISNSLLTVAHNAQPGEIRVVASCGDTESEPLTLTLKNAAAVPTRLSVTGSDGEPLYTLSLSGPAGGDGLSAALRVQVLDQYSAPMDDQTPVWSLSGAPDGVSVSQDGELTVSSALPAGSYSFSLLAGLDSHNLRAAVAVELTLEPQLARLILSGPASAHIPSDDEPLELAYVLSALDAQGGAMPSGGMDPHFTVSRKDGEATTGVSAGVDMAGSFTVTVDRTAQSGEYLLQVSVGDVSADDFLLTLQTAAEDSTSLPVRAAFSQGGSVVTALNFTFLHGDEDNADVSLQLLNRSGLPVTPENVEWTVDVPDLPQGVAYNCHEGSASRLPYLRFTTADAAPGTYFFTVTAQETVSGLSAALPVGVTVLPRIASLTLHSPGELTILSAGTLYPLSYTCLDGNDAPIAPPGPLTWRVTDAAGKTPAGITVEDGQLDISPSAKPGEYTLTLECKAPADYTPGGGSVLASASAQITLAHAQSGKRFVLSRDGELFSGTGGKDADYGKEGSPITLAYTPLLYDPDTGETEALDPEKQFAWIDSPGSFTVEPNAEPGLYTAPISAIYDGQLVSLTAQITVYPDITGLYIQFDDGDTDPKNDRYCFPVPSLSAATYYGTLMATVRRDGTTVDVPFLDLGLQTDYEIDIYSLFTAVYTVYDKATGRFALTIEPTAIDNSMANPDPEKGESEIRYLRFLFSYYPGQGRYDSKQLFLLSKESSQISSVLLRQGSGAGGKFAFETIRGDVALQVSPGVLADCFALELIDQYGNPVTNQEPSWKLTAPAEIKDLVTLVDPGKEIAEKYTRFPNIRRLRVDLNTPEGEYPLTLTASVPGFTRTLRIDLTVSGQQTADVVTIFGSTSSAIPPYYLQYNDPSNKNDKTVQLSYTATAQDASGHELDPSLCDFSWQVLTASGSRPSGVTLSVSRADPTAATVTINRNAHSTVTTDENGKRVDTPLRIIFTATPKGGGVPCASELPLSLTQTSPVPTIMSVNGPSSLQIDLADTKNTTQLYTFDLVTQYNDHVPDLEAKTVKWSVSGRKPSHVSTSTSTDSKGHPTMQLTIRNPGKVTKDTITLVASIEFIKPNTTNTKIEVKAQKTVTITVGSPPPNIPPGDDLPPVTPSSLVSPAVSKTGTTGSAALTDEDAAALTASTASTLTIAPTGASGLTSLTTTFPASLPKALAEKTVSQSLKIKTSLGELTLPKEALRQLGAKSGDISITLRNQNGVVSVSFRAGGAPVSGLSGQILLQAPVNGNTVLDSHDQIIKKAVVVDGKIAAYVTGDTQLKIETRGKVFSDTQNSWAKDAVTFVTARELFQGTSATTFDPSGNMTRSMVVTVLHRLEDTPAAQTATLFADVPDNSWYTDAVGWANAQGIVQGTGSGFLPDDPVSREQLATILYRYMGRLGYSTTKRSSLSAFSDSAQVSPWAKDAVEWAVAIGLINGKTGGLLDPGGNASRAEVATILQRLICYMAPAV